MSKSKKRQGREKRRRRRAKERQEAKLHRSGVGDTANEAARHKEEGKQRRKWAERGHKPRSEQAEGEQRGGGKRKKPRAARTASAGGNKSPSCNTACKARAGGAPNEETQNNKGRDREQSRKYNPDAEGGAAQGSTTRVYFQKTWRSWGTTRDKSIPEKRRKAASTPRAQRPVLREKSPRWVLRTHPGSLRIPWYALQRTARARRNRGQRE